MKNRRIHRQHRGITQNGWLTSYHSFSFGGWYSPDRNGFGTLRVLNDDVVSPEAGFDLHGHMDMEIVSIVLEGQLEHQDTMNHHGILNTGDIQAMSAGTGIRHSEKNPSTTEPVRFLQIWIKPDREGHPPRYNQRSFAPDASSQIHPVVSGGDVADSLTINSNSQIYLVRSIPETVIQLPELNVDRGQYIYLASGRCQLNDWSMVAGDALERVVSEPVHIRGISDALLVLIDVPL